MAAVAAANDDRAGLEALAGLWAALVKARPQATSFRLTVSFDRFRPADAVQLELRWHAPDARPRVVRLTTAVDALNSRYGRPLIGYGQCGDLGGYVGAKITYGRIPALEDFHYRMRLGDYADGAWIFIATCDTCGRQARVDPAEVLTHPRVPHPVFGHTFALRGMA